MCSNGAKRPVRALSLCLLVTAALSTASAGAATMVQAWGNAEEGELGTGSFNDSTRPGTITALTGNPNATVQVAAGGEHSVAVKNGQVYAWGLNFYGELGNNSVSDRIATPVPVNGLSSGVARVAAGWNHSLALKDDGSVVAWGWNVYGQLGDGSTNVGGNSNPAPVTGMGSGVTAIAAGTYHSMAIKNGSVYAWGYNAVRQLGNNSTQEYIPTPVLATGLSDGVTAIAAGDYHNLAVRGGTVYAWGDNGFGELGDGTNITRGTPVALSALPNGVTAIAAGNRHSLAVRNGQVYAWGDNEIGEIGDGTSTVRFTPTLVDPTHLHDIVDVAATGRSSFALSADGSLWVWGSNSSGELGLGTTQFVYRTPQHLLPPTGFLYTSIDADAIGFHVLATLSTVPEPSGIAMLLLAANAAAVRRKRRKQL